MRGEKGVKVSASREKSPPFLLALTCENIIPEENLSSVVVESGGKWGRVDGVGRERRDVSLVYLPRGKRIQLRY